MPNAGIGTEKPKFENCRAQARQAHPAIAKSEQGGTPCDQHTGRNGDQPGWNPLGISEGRRTSSPR